MAKDPSLSLPREMVESQATAVRSAVTLTVSTPSPSLQLTGTARYHLSLSSARPSWRSRMDRTCLHMERPAPPW